MKGFVSVETAMKLKGAGFNHPKVESFQIWYDPFDMQPYVAIVGNGGAFIMHNEKGSQVCSANEINKAWIYAPTVPDILRELGRDFNFDFDKEFRCWVWKFPNHQDSDIEERHINPAEACAAAWLAQKK